MNKETGSSILSSTGGSGISIRSHDRLYFNSKQYSTNPVILEKNFQRLTEVGERHPQEISRNVFRGLVHDNVVQYISNNGFKEHIEVALPVKEFTGDDSWLIYVAKNKPDREVIVPREVMIEQTNFQKKEIISPLQRIQSIVQEGYTFANHIHKDQIEQVHALWGETFGWGRYEIDNFRKRLIRNSDNPPSQKDVWFSAIRDNGNIISAAMAERLEIPSAKVKLDLIESTEWRTGDKYAGNGFMTATITALNAQIVSDLQDNQNGLPIIFAECNFQSRSDRAGNGAGLRIPKRSYAPQILTQNVMVHDGQPVPDGKLRDITIMYLPVETIQNHYSAMQVNSIRRIIQ